ncbi:hypothetical protein C8J57DRAFT_1299348 [Mycena rebaudengoi]|nr:hypothetical protein C8J57DRAFT_1299348 [Mycena rebaudengoi]
MAWTHHRKIRAGLDVLGLAQSAATPNTTKEVSKTQVEQKPTPDPATSKSREEEVPETTKSTTSEASETSKASSLSSAPPASNTSPPVVTNGIGNANKALGDPSVTFGHTTASDTGLPTDAPSIAAASHVNIGAVAGGVAAGIAGIALIIFAVVFIMDFDPVSFRGSAAMVDDVPADPFNPRPPTMIERHLNGHTAAPSVSSMAGGGMAGAGAYSNHGHDYYAQDQYAQDQYAQDQYAQDQYAAAGHQPIQPRQQYTYGQTYEDADHNGSDVGHGAEYNGAYSSDPQQQNIYAAEAYAYPEDDQVVRRTMGRHHQQQFHANNTNDAYGGM